MFIPLIDTLRCVNAHEDTWLVASIGSAIERDIREGVVGCPICSAEYSIRDGVVVFSDRIVRQPFIPPDESAAVRLAAALDLTEARMTAVLHGAWGAHAQLVRGISPAQLVLVNPPDGISSGDGISIVLSDVAPLAHASINAVAIDPLASDDMRASLQSALVAGGRLLAPSASAVPSDFTELVRDAEVWVAQRDPGSTSSAPISIARRPRR